jgi:hypothetical protein
MQNDNTVPHEFAHFFWDASIDDISIENHKRYIVERLLNEGDVQSLQWVIQLFGMDGIKQVICEARGLNRLTARFWQRYFQLREDEMRCFSTSWMSNESTF